MCKPSANPNVRSPRGGLLHALTGLFAALWILAPVFAQTGRITGTVTSSSTGNALQGAEVSLPELGRSTATDSTGRFSVSGVAAGTVKVSVRYSGFQPASAEATVTPGGSAELALVLESTDLVIMEPFTVSTVKEGQALSITEQRNAANIKTVTALDEWGVLPTQNVGELASRLPGITFTTDEDDLVINISVRGQPDSYTRLNIDGLSSTGVSGIGRTATLHSFSASNYEQIEIIAGQTPDKRADSLGGQLNLKTRSPLAMKEKRRTTYTLAGRYSPPWADRNVPLSDHNLHPDFSVSYNEVFSVFGGERNLGISLNASYQEVVRPIDYEIMQYQNTNDVNAYFHDYEKDSGLNHRFIHAFSARADYRWSPSTTVSLRFLYNAGYEPYYDRVRVNPFGPRTIFDPVTTPNGGVAPGFTTTRTEIRPVAGTRFDVETWNFSFTSKNPTGTLAFEHDWGRLKVDHAYRWSHTTWWSGAGRDRQGGQYQSRLNAPLGFILDNTDTNGRVFTQTAGPDIYNFASYTPIVLTNANTTTVPVAQTSRIFTKRDTQTRTNEVSATVNATYDFATAIPLQVKAGLDTVNRRVNSLPVDTRRWYGVVGSVLNTDLMPLSEFEAQHGGTRLPAFNPAAVSGTLGNSALWYEDVNFNATQPYGIGRRILEEGVDAGYVQFSSKLFGRLNVLGGVRHERVTTDTFNYFRARTTAIAAQPDHYLRAALDFQQQTTSGDYAKTFPSIHFSYNISEKLKARASWSTSYGRPTLQQLLPGATANDATQTVTIGDPALRPQESENIDLKLEYYFNANGLVSVGVFKKDITDYISGNVNSGQTVPNGPDNGFEGLYGGYTILRPANIGGAEVEGLEFDYRQRLSFLPGVLKGLSVSANYTYQRTEGRFAGTTVLTTSQVANFVPRLFNARLLYNYKKFGASFDASFKGRHLLVFSTTAGARRFQNDLTRYNAGFTYRLRPDATLFLNFDNITEEGPEQYWVQESRVRTRNISPTSIKFGLTGTF